MKHAIVAVCILTALTGGSLAAQQKRHCGPGKVTFPAPSSVNKACKKHDKAYGREKGIKKYIPGLGSRTIRRADKNLIRDVRNARKSKRLGVGGRIGARAIESYFKVKSTVDRGAGRTRKVVKKVTSRTRSMTRKLRQKIKRN